MTIEKFRIECEEKKIPIIRKETEKLLIDFIKNKKIDSILELGMAVGYSSIIFSKQTNANITTIELDSKNIDIAKDNFKKFNCPNIDIICMDAKEYSTQKKYDLIFFDAGKSWYLEYFNRFKDNLNDNGIMIFDNVFYHGLLQTNMRKHRTIVRKMNIFHEYINTQKEFHKKWYDIDDGILIMSKNEQNI